MLLSSGVVLAQTDNQPGIEDELAALVQTVARLADALEMRLDDAGNQSLERIAVAVHLLDIRTRQQANLQTELRGVDDREQNILGYIAANQTRMPNLDKQIEAAVDETKRIELEGRRIQIEAYNKNNEEKLESLTRRRVEIQNQLIEGERRLADVEDMVQEWLTTDQSSRRGRRN